MKAIKEEMKKMERLLKRSDFLAIAKDGRKWVSKSVIVLTKPNALTSIRVGMTVTKKLDKRSVARNRMKRRLRAASADILSTAKAGGFDVVLIARPDTMTAPYARLCADLRWCLEKLGLLERP
jgi:ribonuclease P protein component